MRFSRDSAAKNYFPGGGGGTHFLKQVEKTQLLRGTHFFKKSDEEELERVLLVHS